jgi:hypothetical protein
MKTFDLRINCASSVAVAVIMMAIMAPVRATADILTLDASGIFTPGNAPTSTCGLSGCTIGGDIVIDNSHDVVTSADVTTSGFAPVMGPFTIFDAVAFGFGTQTVIELSDVAGDTLDFVFDAPTQGSLAGYTGGALNTGSEIFGSVAFSPDPIWFLTSGALTPVPATVPEPGSVILLITAMVPMAGALTRRKPAAGGISKAQPHPTA